MRGAALLLLCVLWVGTAGAIEEPAPAPTPEVAAAPSGEAAAAPPYNPHRRDPFRPFTVEVHPQHVQAPTTPLQRYALGQLTVVATLWDTNPPRAMLEDSEGMGYIVTLGTPIGQNGGVVTAIEPARVVVEERVVDYYGKEKVNRIVMETPNEEAANKPGREQK